MSPKFYRPGEEGKCPQECVKVDPGQDWTSSLVVERACCPFRGLGVVPSTNTAAHMCICCNSCIPILMNLMLPSVLCRNQTC